MNTTETSMLRDVTTRAAHTAWQAGAATAATLWVATGMHVADLAHASGWAHLWTSVVVAAAGAALSAAKTTAAGYAAQHRTQIDQDVADRLTDALKAAQVKPATPVADIPVAPAAPPADVPAGPTVINDTHPVLVDPDRAATDTAPADTTGTSGP